MFFIHEKCAHSNATLVDNRQRQQKNSERRELHAWKQTPLDSDHVLIAERVSHMDWQELCARVSYFSHSAQIQIFQNISMFAM